MWILAGALISVLGLTAFLGSRLVNDIDKNQSDLEIITRTVTIHTEKITVLEKENQKLSKENQDLTKELDTLKSEQLLLPYKIKDYVLIELEKKK